MGRGVFRRVWERISQVSPTIPFDVLRAKPEHHRQFDVPESTVPLLLLTNGRGNRVG